MIQALEFCIPEAAYHSRETRSVAAVARKLAGDVNFRIREFQEQSATLLESDLTEIDPAPIFDGTIHRIQFDIVREAIEARETFASFLGLDRKDAQAVIQSAAKGGSSALLSEARKSDSQQAIAENLKEVGALQAVLREMVSRHLCL